MDNPEMDRSALRIAVASGKGGTGKTTVATSLALSLNPAETHLLDCDVEAPNAHLYMKPRFAQREEVGILIPEVDETRCTACGRCAEVCQFHAIAVLGGKTLVFPELCHGCGSCTLACPEEAISEVLNVTGVLEAGETPEGIAFGRGVLDIGQPMAVPLIRQLKKQIGGGDRLTVILDASPGASCPVVETLRGADVVLLVTEPTPFGLHDLRLAVELTHELDLPAGVVINRDGIGNAQVEEYCREKGLPVLMRIPMEQRIAVALAKGETLISAFPEYLPRFRTLYEDLLKLAQGVKEGGTL